MECEIPDMNASNDKIDGILDSYKTVAVVGLSTNPEKDSYKVGAFLKEHGYTVIPVHPKAEEILGEQSYASLKDIPGPVDIVCLFRPPDQVPPFVDDAIDIHAKVVWMQQGIVKNDAARKAREAGVDVVMNKCMTVELARKLG